MLLMLDLDNTLVDRDAAFRLVVADLLAEHGQPAADGDWVMSIDGSGFEPREDVERAMVARYGAEVPVAAIRALLNGGAAERVELSDDTRSALEAAKAGGWRLAIVTNGRVPQQEKKIRRTGLDAIVDAWVVSDGVGHRKPEPEIFHAAAVAAGTDLAHAWMIGDNESADIAGADRLGLPNVWVSNGRAWVEQTFRPTHVALTCVAAIHHVLSRS
ncbi:HAD family hydrolase [Tenggerimyces flavus]|uniref:HAD family hydrolase n=1 Tax=Tenggerimyces flavus TaxID=1708749 RepID=A0ABV7Y9S4_9ACTN|nr:HAD family hydrolase [Tenggerimyces flavus]MBM7791086.1 putative hydrolase of the HAD superfamily [Tenggerimyces flavus]